ncbi:MAG: LysM peptidoglycan-binding domain-containing protein [Planctomycetes bacterium]|nr:LysM peptidoglycan-binding domain-containing protein [Planctomycetota bacterium]
MADRVKYFLLGVLFLVVAGVIAYDRWNSAGESPEIAEASGDDTTGDFDALSVRPDAPKTEPTPPANPGQQPQLPPSSPPGQSPPTPGPSPDPVVPAPGPKPEVKPAPKPPEPKPEPARTHVIRKGETLEAIAIKYYGTREGIEWIVDANGLPNANRIYANQKLVIPAKKVITKERGSGDAAATAKAPAKIPSRYTVKESDGDLYAICRRIYGPEAQGARVSRIMELNHLWSADVKAGTVLILPSK